MQPTITALKHTSSVDNVIQTILDKSTTTTVVAIDAPLIINNETGQRPCETLIGKKFGARHASAHTSNLTLYPEPDSVRVANMLEEQGFHHNPNPAHDRRRSGRWFFEVYPHPAHVILFDLERIIGYKKRRVQQQRQGLRVFQEYLRRLQHTHPALYPGEEGTTLLKTDVSGLKGKRLKEYEDYADAYFCCYLALHYWDWGGERNERIGDTESGYIINPTHPLNL